MIRPVKTMIKSALPRHRRAGPVPGRGADPTGNVLGRRVPIRDGARMWSSGIGDHGRVGPASSIVEAGIGGFGSIAPGVIPGSGGHPAPRTVHGGVPARLIRERFGADDVAFLRRLRWWDRDMNRLRRHAAALGDVGPLRAAVEADPA